MSRIIQLTRGFQTIVDDDDYEWLNQWKWKYSHATRSKPYAARSGKPVPGRGSSAFMHRVILNAPPHLQVDHINGDGLDNRRSNLRLATQSQNGINRGPVPASSSRFKGVSWWTATRKWRAAIMVNKVSIYLGQFDDEVEAARVYDAAAIHFFGEYAYTNFNSGL